MTINSDNAGPIFLLTFAAFVVSLVIYRRRGRHPAARAALIVSTAVLGTEVMFGALFLMTLSTMPNMADF
jgi:hypothetical protein